GLPSRRQRRQHRCGDLRALYLNAVARFPPGREALPSARRFCRRDESRYARDIAGTSVRRSDPDGEHRRRSFARPVCSEGETMRSHFVSRIKFLGLDFRMNSIKDEWGIDDVVQAEMNAGTYGEADALSWWRAM